jgi:hypothetical protein
MTREQTLEEALRTAIKIADEAREEWDKAPSNMKAGKLLIALSGHLPGYRPDIDSVHAALASAQQEPAPAAEAEIERCISRLADRTVVGDERNWNERILRQQVAALHRYAGDGGVTEQQSEEALEDAAVQLEARAYDLEHLYDKKAHADEIFDIAQELRSRTAARAKSDEKGGANV